MKPTIGQLLYELEKIESNFKNPNYFYIIANVALYPPFYEMPEDFTIYGWKIVPSSGGRNFYKQFSVDRKIEDYYSALHSLKKILLAFFISDFEPRKIKGFYWTADFGKEKGKEIFDIVQVFGMKNSDCSLESNTLKHSGGIFRSFTEKIITNEQIEEWYKIFGNVKMFDSVSLMQEAFLSFNKQFSEFSHFDTAEFLSGIAVLVSALENLFLSGNKEGEYAFKFRVIGSLYYEKYVTEEFLKEMGGPNLSKYSTNDFRDILKLLYDLRSSVAHGDINSIFSDKRLSKLIKKLKVHYNDQTNNTTKFKSAALALGLLQNHIFALVIQAKDNLLGGIKIIDEIKI